MIYLYPFHHRFGGDGRGEEVVHCEMKLAPAILISTNVTATIDFWPPDVNENSPNRYRHPHSDC